MKVTLEEVIDLMREVREKNDTVEDADLREELFETYTLIIDTLVKQGTIKACAPDTDDWEKYADRLYDLAYAHGALDAKEGLI